MKLIGRLRDFVTGAFTCCGGRRSRRAARSKGRCRIPLWCGAVVALGVLVAASSTPTAQPEHDVDEIPDPEDASCTTAQ